MASVQETCLELAVMANVPTLLMGAPGIGKTSRINQLAEFLKLRLWVKIGAIHDPTDFSGFPVNDNGMVRMAAQHWGLEMIDAQEGILFLDEFTLAPPAVQSAMLRLTFERVLGDLELPKAIRVIAAANPVEQTLGGWDLSLPLANRFFHLEWGVNYNEWIEGILSDWTVQEDFVKVPLEWESHIQGARAMIAAFIQSRPNLLLQVPTEPALAWPSPRSWDMAARLYAIATASGVDDTVLHTLMGGSVGKGPTVEFLHWIKTLDIPTPKEVLDNPALVDKITRDDHLYAVVMGMTQYVLMGMGEKNGLKLWNAGWEVLGRIAKTRVDVGAIGVKQLAAHYRTVKRGNLPLPVQHIQPYSKLLKAAGIGVGDSPGASR